MFLVLFFFFHSASIYEKLLWIRHSFKEFEIQQWTKEKKQSLHFQLSLIKRISWKFCCSTELRTQTQDSDPVNLRKGLEIYQFSSVQFSCSVVSDSATPWTVACHASLFIINSWSLLKLVFIESVMPSNHLILCHPLLLPPSIFPSIRGLSESVLRIKWPKYWSFSFSISPSNEY